MSVLTLGVLVLSALALGALVLGVLALGVLTLGVLTLGDHVVDWSGKREVSDFNPFCFALAIGLEDITGGNKGGASSSKSFY